jgi:hypothetical protein
MKSGIFYRWIMAAFLLLAGTLQWASSPAAAQEEVSYYRLVKVDTFLDHENEPDAGWIKEWLSWHKVTRETDGSIITQGFGQAHYMPAWWGKESSNRIRIDQGKANWNQVDPDGSLEINWTQPPALWSSNQDFKFSAWVKASGSPWGGLRLEEYPVERFTISSQDGANLWKPDGIVAGKYSSGFKPNDSGSITFRPRPKITQPFTLIVDLTVEGYFLIDYHYEPVPAPVQAPSPTASPSPQMTITQAPSLSPRPTATLPPNPSPTPAPSLSPKPTATLPPKTASVPATSAPPSTQGGNVIPTPPYGGPEPYTGSPGMTLQAGQRRVLSGGLVSVPVWLINAVNVANSNFEVRYDANVARPEGTILKGSLLDDALFTANPNESGIIRAGFAQTSGSSGTGTVAAIPFRAAGQAGDRTPLTLSVTKINDPGGSSLPVSLIFGEILIVGPDGLTPGDCNGDGRLTALDALCALEMSVRLKPEKLNLDMDADRQISSRDAVLILKSIFTTSSPNPGSTPAQIGDFLGVTWQIQEGLQSPYREGTWTRRGTTDLFDGVWKLTGQADVRAKLQITLKNDEVVVRRTEGTDGNSYLYLGSFNSGGQVSGVFFTGDDGRYQGTWSATIQGGLATAPARPVPVVRPLPAPAVTEAEANTRIQQVVKNIDPNRGETLDTVEDIVAIGRMGVPFLVQSLNSQDLVTRWSAVYALSRLAGKEDIPALVSGLSDSNLSLRSIIAATLLRLGDSRGLAVLNEASISDQQLVFSSPPRLLKDYAVEVLKAYGKSTLAPGIEEEYAYSLANESRSFSQRAVIPISFRYPPGTFLKPVLAVPHVEGYEGGLRYVLYIEFFGPGMLSNEQGYTLKAGWENAITGMWSNVLEWTPGTKMGLIVRSKIRNITDPPTPGYDQVSVVNMLPGQPHRSNAENWASNDTNNIVAHEAGHLLGIKDEYVDTPAGNSVPKPEYVAESRTDPSIMVRVDNAPNGHPPTAKPARHSKMVIDMLKDMEGLEGPWWTHFPSVPATGPVTVTPAPTANMTPPNTSLPGAKVSREYYQTGELYKETYTREDGTVIKMIFYGRDGNIINQIDY